MDIEVTKAEATARVAALTAVLQHLPAKDLKFAKDLMQSTIDKGPTRNRLYWLGILIERAEQNKGAPAAPPAGAPAEADLGSFTGVYALFSAALQVLKKPKIRLQLANNSPLILAPASGTGKYSGQIVVDDGGGFGYSRFYGVVNEDGHWTKPSKHHDELPEVEGLLKKLAEKPAETAAEYGRLTGRCCFCNRKLEDPISTAAGFGPVCAVNFGLGDVRKEATPILEAVMNEEA